MRVTQSMLSNNMLRNLSASYNKMGKLQEQLTSGKKVNRPSDDPVTVMKGMGYRKEVDKVMQYQRNLGETTNWLDSTDDTLDHVGSALHRANELMVNASTGSLTQEDREAILEEIKQLRETARDLANTKIGDKYIFSGTKTGTPLFENGAYQDVTDPDSPFLKDISIEVFDGVSIKGNINGAEMFTDIDKMFEDIETAIESGDSADLDQFISSTQTQLDAVLTHRAEVGARQNRVEMMGHRLTAHEGIAKKQMSENEDIDYEKVITEMLTEESIHRAALSVGARIIQPSLVDFLR